MLIQKYKIEEENTDREHFTALVLGDYSLDVSVGSALTTAG